MTTAFYAHTDTPDGPFTVIVSDGAVLGSGWTSDPKDLLPRIHQSLLPSALEESDTEAEFALDAVRKYYDGDFAAVLRTPVRQVSGEFRSHAWDVLRDIGPGQCITYSDFAALAGRPQAVRAAASACSQNAAALFVPCHRVLSKDGSLGGFLYGTDVKKRLLEMEEDGSGE